MKPAVIACSDKIIIKIKMKGHSFNINIIQVYAQISDKEEEKIE